MAVGAVPVAHATASALAAAAVGPVTRPGVDVRGRKSGMGSHQQTVGDSVEWYTPPGIFDALTAGARRSHQVFFDERFEFDLDPCAPPGGLPWIPAATSYCEADDGLTQPWRGRVWLNPPYGRHTGSWLRRLAAHGDGIALVFARTETEWWHEVVPTAAAVCFIAGRITFVDAERRPGKFNGGAPSALIAWGGDCAAAVAHAGLGMTFAVRARELDGQASLWET